MDSSNRRWLLGWLHIVVGCRELYRRVVLKKLFVAVELSPTADAKGAVIRHLGNQFWILSHLAKWLLPPQWPIFLQLKAYDQRGDLLRHIIFGSDRNCNIISMCTLRVLIVMVFDASENVLHADSALFCHFFCGGFKLRTACQCGKFLMRPSFVPNKAALGGLESNAFCAC